jgi:hypothetical protein
MNPTLTHGGTEIWSESQPLKSAGKNNPEKNPTGSKAGAVAVAGSMTSGDIRVIEASLPSSNSIVKKCSSSPSPDGEGRQSPRPFWNVLSPVKIRHW